MAVDAPLLSRQRVFGAAVETTTGTAVTLTNSHGVFNAFDHDLKPDVPFNERFGQSSLSRITGTTGARAGTMTFRTDLVGAGTSGTAYWCDTLLLASGFSLSGSTYSPVTGSASATTLTMGFLEDGDLRNIAGAVGKFTMTFKAGESVPIAWEFLGKLIAPSSQSLLAPTYPTTIPPRFASATFTIGGTAYKVSEVTLAVENVLQLRHAPTDVTGYHAAVIVDRRITWTVDPEAVGFSTKNWYTDQFAHTEAAINLVVGSASNNTITINSPKAQLTEAGRGDRDGILTDALVFQANRSASAGDDELTIVMS